MTSSTFATLSLAPSTILASNPHLTSLAVGAVIVRKSDSKLLLVRRSATEDAFPNLWEIPGGGWEPGKDATLREALVREVREETALEVVRIVRMADVDGDGDGDGWIEFRGRSGRMWRKYTVVVEVEEGGEVVVAPDEHSEYRWVGKGETDGLEMTSVDMRKTVDSALEWIAKEG